MSHVSSQITSSQYPASGTLTVASGQPIRVQTILLTTGTAGGSAQVQFTITDNDDVTLFEVPLLADTSFILGVETHFSNGLKIVSDTADASAAVFHTSPGN